MTDITIWQVASSAWPYILSYCAGHGGSELLRAFRAKLHKTREFVDLIDNAVNDPNVTDVQFKAMWDAGKGILAKN